MGYDPARTMAKSKNKSKATFTPRIENRRARHDYHILDRLETGIELLGSEVKSIRQGHVSLGEGYARIHPHTLQLSLVDVEIAHYREAGVNQHEPKRSRRLLAHKREIRQWQQALQAQNATLIPLVMYFKEGRVKVEIGLAIGKRQHDKRNTIRQRDAERDMRRAMTRKTLR